MTKLKDSSFLYKIHAFTVHNKLWKLKLSNFKLTNDIKSVSEKKLEFFLKYSTIIGDIYRKTADLVYAIH